MISFNKPCLTGYEQKYVLQSMQSEKISGDGYFSKQCQAWFEDKLHCRKALLTPSCTAALEMAAILIDIQPGDEVIMPSYTFVSTANAFVLRGATIVFVDIRPDTMNIDEHLIEQAITPKTKAIVPVHYAGVGCDMDAIMCISKKHNLFVIEDAAQGLMSSFNEKPLGSLGHLGVFSFHETKNYTSAGEGGLLIINDERFVERAEVIREKGTNRSKFFRGQVDKYSWVDIGSSFLMSDVQAAYLWGQIERSNEINENRLKSWNLYQSKLESLEKSGDISLPIIPNKCVHNAHMFYIKTKDLCVRGNLMAHLNKNGVQAVFHYVPLHTSCAGLKFGKFRGDNNFTTSESEKLLRLPMYFGIEDKDQAQVVDSIRSFFK